MNEFKRLLRPKFLLIIIFAMVFNICLFAYQQFEGRSFADMNFEREQRVWLTQRYSKLSLAEAKSRLDEESQMLSRYISKSNGKEIEEFIDTDNDLIVRYDSFDEDSRDKLRTIIKELKQKVSYIEKFSTDIDEIMANAEKLKKFSIFSKPDSFSYNNIIRSADDFSRLQGLELSLANDTGVDKFTGYYYTFYIAMGLMVLVVYSLFAERENGVWSVVHSAGSGRLALGFARVFSLTSISAIITAALYFSTFVTSMFIYGGWECLELPIQNLQQYAKFTHILSAGEYIFVNYLLSWLAICGLSIFLWLLFSICRKRNHALILTGIVFGLETLMYNNIQVQSIYGIFKQVNVVRLLNINKILGTYENCGTGKFVISVLAVTMTVVVGLTIVSAVIGVISVVKMRPEQKKSIIARFMDSVWSGYQKIFAGFPLIFKEFHKLLITGKGIAVVVVMIIMAMYFSAYGKMTFSDFMKEKDAMYLEKGGKDYSEIVELVNTRISEYQTSAELVEKISEKYNKGEATQEELVNAVNSMQAYSQRLNSVKEFSEKIEYLERIEQEYGVEGYLISDRGYEEIFGEHSTVRELILLIILTSGVMLIISETSLLESRTGMNSIVRAALNGRAWLGRRKIIANVILTFILFAAVYVIDYIQLATYYGMPFLDAPLMSLTFMEGCPVGITIGGWLVLRYLLRLIVVYAVMVIAIVASKLIGKKGSRALTPLLLVGVIAIVLIIEKMGWLL